MSKMYYNPKTKKKISEEEWKSLGGEEQKAYREWKDRPPTRSNGSDDVRRQDERGAKTTPTLQDYEWWNVSDSISKAVANIPFNRFPGTRIRMNGQTIANAYSGIANRTIAPGQPLNMPDYSGETIAGVLALNYIPTWGNDTTEASALNMAKRAVYSWVRHHNSGRTNYDAPDLMLYIMAMDAVIMQFQEACRVYEIAMTYTYENKYIPVSLANAMNLDLDQITSNLANYRYGLNLFAAKLSSMCIPDKFDIVKRHALLARSIFLDADTLRAQMYVFNATGFWVFDPNTATTGGRLKYVNHTQGSSGATTQTILSDLNTALGAILQDEDMNIMSGDILKAYGEQSLFTIAGIDENATITFTRNEEVLQQIENSSSLSVQKAGGTYSTKDYFPNDSFYYSQNENGTLYWNSTNESLADGVYVPDLYIVNSHKDNPDYADVLEYTRDICEGLVFGTELIVDYTIAQIKYANVTATDYSVDKFSFNTRLVVNISSTTGGERAGFRAITLISQFDWHPIIHLYTSIISSGSTTYMGYYGPIGDFKNVAAIAPEDAQNLHDSAIMGVLGKLKMG